MRIADILQHKKNTTLHTISPETLLLKAIHTMAELDTGSLLVVQGERLVGVLSFREALNSIAQHMGLPSDLNVGAVMNTEPLTTTLDVDLPQLMETMLATHTRYVPVMQGDKPTAVLSFHDLMRASVAETEQENQLLKHMISG